MDLKEIITVTSKPGLYIKIGATKTGIIVESVIDKKRIPVYASDKMSTLQDISIFTTDEDTTLKEVFKKIHAKENGGKSIDHKSEDKILKEYFGQVLPEYDKQRVYVSDIRKVLNWYNILLTHDLLDLTDKPEEEAVEENIETAEKPKKSENNETTKKPAAVKSDKAKNTSPQK